MSTAFFISIFLNFFSFKRCLSPVIIISALPRYAVSSIILSVGSSFITSISPLGITISENKMISLSFALF